MSLLKLINKPNDVKKIPEHRLPELARDIRKFLIKNIAKNGGHLAPNLGIVELTIALHRYLKFPKDKLIFDVGHQSYVHKLLTGRKEGLKSLRQLGGISGFPKINESDCDAFGTGHASTSISAGLGFVVARDLNNTNEKIVVVIGDGAMTGGMALEALNNAGVLKTNFIIVLNDNERSISENVGAIKNFLGGIRTNSSYIKLKDNVKEFVGAIPLVGNKLVRQIETVKEVVKRAFIQEMLFEDMGLTYIGPVDGHDIKSIEAALESAGRVRGATIVHVITKKGKGYLRAERHPAKFHGVEAFVPKTGEAVSKKDGKSYTDIFSETVLELAKSEKNLVTITAAMPYGTGLYNFKKEFPDRFFDVGIAEEHAVTFAAGMAAAGLQPIVAIYSTFLQRAYDQLVHDVCLQNLPVVFAVDRAGLVGRDGETHQGILDISYLSTIPGLTILSPKNGAELREMIRYAYFIGRPAVVRYPRGMADTYEDRVKPIVEGENEIIEKGKNVVIIATGKTVKLATEVVKILKESNINPSLVSIRFLKRVDVNLLLGFKEEHETIVTIEESIYTGSYTERLMAASAKNNFRYRFIPITLPDSYIEHGSIEELWEKYGFTAEKIAERIKEVTISKLEDELFRR